MPSHPNSSLPARRDPAIARKPPAREIPDPDRLITRRDLVDAAGVIREAIIAELKGAELKGAELQECSAEASEAPDNLTALEQLWNMHPCFICGRRRQCQHREPEVDLALLEAQRRRELKLKRKPPQSAVAKRNQRAQPPAPRK